MKAKTRNTIILSAVLTTVLSVSAFGLTLKQKDNVEITENNLKQTKSSKEDKVEEGFEYKFTRSGGTSSVIVASINGVEHVFGWGNNNMGQLGVGTEAFRTEAGADALSNPDAYLSTLWHYVNGSDDELASYANSLSNMPTPEDINIDGGAAGIQGEVVDIAMGNATTYAVIRNNESGTLDVWATGSNVYGQLGTGYGANWVNEASDKPTMDADGTNYSVVDTPKDDPNTIDNLRSAGYGYRSKWEKIKFYDNEGKEVVFKELNTISSVKSTFISGIDTEGKNRIFAWGAGGSGMLGTATNGWGTDFYHDEDSLSAEDSDGSFSNAKSNWDIQDTPREITQNFLVPVIDGGSYVTNDSFVEGATYGFVDGIRNSDSMVSAESYFIPTPDNASYPFEVTNLEGSGWEIKDIKLAKTASYFVAEHTSGKKVIFSAGATKGVEGYVFEANGAESFTSIPTIWYWDGMPGKYLFPDGTTFASASEIILKDFDVSVMNLLLAVNIDGRDHLIDFNRTIGAQYDQRLIGAPSDISPSSKGTNHTWKGNGQTIYISSDPDGRPDITDVNLGYSIDGTKGLKEGDEIVETFMTTNQDLTTSGALIKTKAPDGKDIYSLIGWGVNGNQILSDINTSDKGDSGGSFKKDAYNTNTTMALTTATSKDQIADNTLLEDNANTTGVESWDELVSQGRTLNTDDNGWYRKQHTSSSYETADRPALEEVVPGYNYIIENVVDGGTSLAYDLVVQDDTGKEIERLRYFFGDNSAKQISSSIDKDNIGSPVSLYLAAPAISDSFSLNQATVQDEGIDFSIQVVHGGEIEKFEPFVNTDGTTDGNTVKLYADIDYSGSTDTSKEEIGTSETYGSSSSGKIAYIGRGSERTGGTDKVPEYDMNPISEADQEENTYTETYNFRVTGLKPGESFGDLYVSVNGHNPVKVDGTLKTLQNPKFTDDISHIELLDSSSDYFEIKTEIMYDVPGYGELGAETISEETLLDQTIIYFEGKDASGEDAIFTNNVDVVSKDTTLPTTTIHELTLEVSNLGAPGDSGQTVEIGESAIGQSVNLKVSSDQLAPGSLYNNFKFYLDVKDNVNQWETPGDFSAMTLMDSSVEFTTDKLAEFKPLINDPVVTADTAQFSLDIKSDTIISESGDSERYSTIDPTTVVITADSVYTSGGDIAKGETLNSTATIDNSVASAPVMKINITDLEGNATYSNINITAKDNSATPKDITTVLEGEIVTNAKDIELIEAKASTDISLVDADSAAIDIEVKEFTTHSAYQEFDFTTNNPTVTGTGSFGTTDFSAEYNSTTPGTEGNIYTYVISGFQAVETLEDFTLSFDDGATSFDFTIDTSIASAGAKISEGSLTTTGHDKTSVSYKLAVNKSDDSIAWDKHELIKWEETSMTVDVEEPGETLATNTIGKDDVEIITKPTEDGNTQYIEFKYSTTANTKVTVKDYTVVGSTFGAQTFTTVPATETTDAEASTILTESITATGITNDTLVFQDIETKSVISDLHYTQITQLKGTLSGGSNTVDSSSVADAVVTIDNPTEDKNTLTFEGLKANTTYKTLTIEITDSYGTTNKALDLTNATTFSNSLTDAAFSDGDVTVDTSVGTAVYKVNVAESTLTEDIDLTDFKFNGYTGGVGTDASAIGVTMSMTANDSDITNDMAFADVKAGATYDQAVGVLTINLEGLMNNVTYQLDTLTIKDIDNEAIENTFTSNLNPEKDIVVTPIEFKPEDIVISSATMDNVDYLEETLSITLNDIKHGGDTEAFDSSKLTAFKDSEGNTYTVSNFNSETTTDPADGSETEFNITLDITPDYNVSGKNLTIDTIIYDGTEYTLTTPATYQTYKLFDSSVDTYLYSNNSSEIKDETGQLTLELGTPENGLEYYGVEFTTATINGQQYNLSEQTRSGQNYLVEGFVAEDGVSYELQSVNGVELSTPTDLGTVTFDEVPEPPVEPEEDKDKGFPWWIIILITILTLGIAGIIIFFVLKSKNKDEEKEDIDYSKMSVAQLKEEATKKGIDFDKSAKKADLIELLQGK